MPTLHYSLSKRMFSVTFALLQEVTSIATRPTASQVQEEDVRGSWAYLGNMKQLDHCTATGGPAPPHLVLWEGMWFQHQCAMKPVRLGNILCSSNCMLTLTQTLFLQPISTVAEKLTHRSIRPRLRFQWRWNFLLAVSWSLTPVSQRESPFSAFRARVGSCLLHPLLPLVGHPVATGSLSKLGAAFVTTAT